MKKLKLDYIFPFLSIVAIGIIVYATLMFQDDNVTIDNEQVENVSNGWVMQKDDGIRTLAKLPYKLHINANKKIILTKNIPNRFEGLNLFFQTSDQLLKVYIDEKEIYSFGYNNVRAFGKTPGTAYHLIPLPDNLKNSTIKIEITSLYNNYGGNLPNIYVGTKSAGIFHLLEKNIIYFLISFIAFFFSAGLIILYFVAKNLHKNLKSLLHLGEFVMIMSLATMIDTRLLQFYFGDQAVFSVGIFLLYMLGPIPLSFYLGDTCFFFIKRKIYIFSLVYMANFIINIFLQVFHIFDFMETSTITHLLTFIGCVYIIAAIIKHRKVNAGNRSLMISFAALLIYITSVLLDIFDYYLFPTSDSAGFQRLGLLFYVVILCALDLNKSMTLIKKGAETDILRHIAYEDALTKCKNRIYFDKIFGQMENNINSNANIAVAIFDVNNLKSINDLQGHLEGDNVLIQSANFLNEHFSKHATICRIGGDEFAFISTGTSPSQLDYLFLQFIQTMEEKQDMLAIPLEVACGYAFYDEAVDDNLQRTFDRADRKMYERKKEMKSKS